MVWLMDCYRGLLTARQCEAMSLYYEEDLSLSEMAENMGVSRQAAHDLLHRSTAQLQEWESQIGMARRYRQVDAFLESLLAKLDTDTDVLKQSIMDFQDNWKND